MSKKRVIYCVFSVHQHLYNWISNSGSRRMSHSEIVKANQLQGAIRTVTLNAVWLNLLYVDCDNAEHVWTTKCCCHPREAVTKPGWQAELTRRTLWNTKNPNRCQLMARNRLSDGSRPQSQILPDLRCFISFSRWDSSRRVLKTFCIWKRADCILHKDFMQATYINPIPHTEVLGWWWGARDAIADALKQHTDDSDAECTNIRVVFSTQVFASHLYKPALK